MKTYKLTALLIVAMMSTAMWAQKDNPYLKSYNYVRALELLEKDNNSKEAMSLLAKEIAERTYGGRDEGFGFVGRGEEEYGPEKEHDAGTTHQGAHVVDHTGHLGSITGNL